MTYNLISRGFIAAMALLLSITITFAQSKTEQLDQLINTYVEYDQFNGSVLVAEQGKVIYKKGFGMANIEWDIPNQPNTKHRLGSVTKQFTAMLILQLAAEGKLDLNAPITTYLPDYPKKTGDQITTHHLLTHTSGIPNYTSFPGFFREDSRDPYAPDEFVDKFAGKELEFTPGERFNYSNSGYFLLGVIIEKLSGKTYEEMLHEKILDPVGMNDTGYDHHGTIMKNRATGYEWNGATLENSRYIDMSIPYAAGSMYSTVEDLYKWDQALYSNDLLSKEYMDMFFTPYVKMGNDHYAYGWVIGNYPVGNTSETVEVITHGGGINGFNTIISRMVEDKTLIVLLNNTGGAPLEAMSGSIKAILDGNTFDLPKKSLAKELYTIFMEQSIDRGLSWFKENKDSEKYDLSENEMNSIGYQLMGAGKLKEAAEVFKLNIEAFPNSFNTYDSYGEALMNMGEKELAIKNYKKSVEMNPANQNGIDMLKKLGVEADEVMKEVEVSDEVLETYVGKYELAPGFILSVSREGNKLMTQATGQPAFEIFARAENVFYPKAFPAQLTFNKGKDGKIESVTLLQNGQEIVGKRLEE